MPINLGGWEWAILLIIVLIVFGVGKLPQVGKSLGEGLRNFKDGMKDGAADKKDGDKDQLDNQGKK